MPTVEQSRRPVGAITAPAGWEGFYAREKEVYLEITERWRNAPKPTIGEVQGAVVAGGLMLAWACDLLVCADDARFRDNTAAGDGHSLASSSSSTRIEMGVRKAKEWLFTGGWLGALRRRSVAGWSTTSCRAPSCERSHAGARQRASRPTTASR